MRTQEKTNKPQPWHKALAQPAKEFTTTTLKILFGKIPEDLSGTYFQNGTGRLQRGNQSVGHWFDGDGAILRVAIGESQATGTYRYVKTKGYLEETAANKFLYGNYGRRYPGPLWKHIPGLFTGNSVKNAANTAVFALPDKLLALWEAGNPHSLDLETLETYGIDSLGWLNTAQQFSAHPLRDPISGEIYSIGVTPQCQLKIYRCNNTFNLIKQVSIPLKTVPMVHSFVIAGPYLVFLVSPVVIDPLKLLLNQQSFAEAAEWKAQQGTRILIVDRETLNTVSDSNTDDWFQWHYGNGCIETDGSIRIDFVRFDDFTHINKVLREVPTGHIKTEAYGRLWQIRLEPTSGKVLSNECVLDRDCEFPKVAASKVGQPWQHTYFMMHRDGVSTGANWFGALGRFNYVTGQLLQADLGEGYYANEPMHVSNLNGKNWLLDVVFNANEHQSEFWIFDADTLGEPICRLALPSTIPLGFHGTWQSNS